jgi:hypothetical protein
MLPSSRNAYIITSCELIFPLLDVYLRDLVQICIVRTHEFHFVRVRTETEESLVTYCYYYDCMLVVKYAYIEPPHQRSSPWASGWRPSPQFGRA